VHRVEGIEAKKLTPFFTKEHIAIPAHSEERYLKEFVLKTMLVHEVTIRGIPVREIRPVKRAFLSLERDVHGKFTLIPSFRYEGEEPVYPDTPRERHVALEEIDGRSGIRCYRRDVGWETRLVALLQAEGLRAGRRNHFYPPGEGEDAFALIEWLSEKEERLSRDFVIEQELERVYFTRGHVMESTLDVKIDWFEVNMTVVIGPFRVPFTRFKRHILAGNREYILPDKRVFILPREWFERYYPLFRHGEEQREAIRLKKMHAPVLDHALEPPGEERGFYREIAEEGGERPALPLPSTVTLRPYQVEGFYWLERLYRNGFGGCLADDMGLGKTLQVITLLRHVYGGGGGLPATLVVTPTSLLHNWYNEVRRFAPELRVYLYTGDKRARGGALERGARSCQVVICSYGIARNDIEHLRDTPFHLVILDESQHVKNPGALTYRSIIQLPAARRFVLTGTPVENSLEELWAQFNFVNEGILGSLTSFKRDFVQKITREKDAGRERLLKRMIAPFLLRRTKEEVAPELPPLLQERVYCNMTGAQQVVYEAEKNRARNLLLEVMEHPGESRGAFVALRSLHRLRQVANHPLLVEPDYAGGSGKFDQIIMAFESLKASGHKVLVFSSYVRHLQLLARHFDARGWRHAMLTGDTRDREAEIRRFTEERDVHCFFISLKAGATGLNLTAADYVFIIDPWWNPASEMQALSRAHRIGQEKKVIVYRYISSETVEEKMLLLQASKTALYDTFINTGSPLEYFSREELEGLLA
jgi:superfamily II DNA or RNA helicase